MAKTVSSSNPSPQGRPPITPEAKENQMISLAMDLVEQRLRDGTATSQETTHFLKLATTKHRKELAILEEQRKLIVAKTSELESRKETKAMFEAAIKAMRTYSGKGDVDEDTDIF